jgi:hypothetical protein
MDIDAIMKVLPHRYPFLLVDRVTELVSGDYAHGYKNVTVNDNFFPGHFPGRPLMPGVLQVKANLPFAPCPVHPTSYTDDHRPGASMDDLVHVAEVLVDWRAAPVTRMRYRTTVTGARCRSPGRVAAQHHRAAGGDAACADVR